jgi:hypothetical protein
MTLLDVAQSRQFERTFNQVLCKFKQANGCEVSFELIKQVLIRYR